MDAKSAGGSSVLKQFSEAVRSWFLDTFEEPTALQEQAWGVIEEGHHVLVVAPTGSGKTLAAFFLQLKSLCKKKHRVRQRLRKSRHLKARACSMFLP